MSLLELVVALGISGAVSVFVADLMTEQSNKNSLLMITHEINLQHDVMQKTLRNKEACQEILEYADAHNAFTSTDGLDLTGIGRKIDKTPGNDQFVGINVIEPDKIDKIGKYGITRINIKNSPASAFVKTLEVTYTIPNKKFLSSDKKIVRKIEVLAEKTKANGLWKCGDLVENTKKEATRKMCESFGEGSVWIEDASNPDNYTCELKEFFCEGKKVPTALTQYGKFECKDVEEVLDMTELVDSSAVDCTGKPNVSLVTSGSKIKLSCTGPGGPPAAGSCVLTSTTEEAPQDVDCIGGKWYTDHFDVKDAGGSTVSTCFKERGHPIDCKLTEYVSTCPPSPVCTGGITPPPPVACTTKTEPCPSGDCSKCCTPSAGYDSEGVPGTKLCGCTEFATPMTQAHCCEKELRQRTSPTDTVGIPVSTCLGDCFCMAPTTMASCPLTKPSCLASPNIRDDAGPNPSYFLNNGCDVSDVCTDSCLNWGPNCENTVNCRYKMVGVQNCVIY